MPDRDAAVLATATRAGLVCLGKTHLTELAFSGLGHQPGDRAPRRTSTTPSSRPAAPPPAPPPRSPSAWRRRRSARTPPARCGSRPPGTTSSGSRPPTACCRSTACVPLLPALRHRRPALPLGRGRRAAPRRARRARPPTSPAPALARRPLPRRSTTREPLPDPRRAAGGLRGGARPARRRRRPHRPRRRSPPSPPTLALFADASPAPRPTASGARRSRRNPELMFAPIRDRFRAGAAHRRRRLRRRLAPLDAQRAAWTRRDRRLRRGAAADHRQPAAERRAPARRPGATSPPRTCWRCATPARQPARPLRPDPADRRPGLRPDGDGRPAATTPGCCGSAAALERALGIVHRKMLDPRGTCRLHFVPNGAPSRPRRRGSSDAVPRAVLRPAGIRLSATAAAARGHRRRAGPSSP